VQRRGEDKGVERRVEDRRRKDAREENKVGGVAMLGFDATMKMGSVAWSEGKGRGGRVEGRRQ
jgi:hypothetical protein